MNTFWGLTSRDFYAGYKRIQGMPKTFYLEGQYLRTSSYSGMKLFKRCTIRKMYMLTIVKKNTQKKPVDSRVGKR